MGEEFKVESGFESGLETPEEIAGYGRAFWGTVANKEKLGSLFKRGIVPERWIKDSGFSNGSYDSICYTAIPEGQSARDRFKAMTMSEGNLNPYMDKISEGSDEADQITLGILFNMEEFSTNDAIRDTKTNGTFDDRLYPSDRLPGVRKMRRQGYGYRGEVRVYMKEDPDEGVSAEKYWNGIVINKNNLDKFRNMVDELKEEGFEIPKVSIFSEEMELLETT